MTGVYRDDYPMLGPYNPPTAALFPKARLRFAFGDSRLCAGGSLSLHVWPDLGQHSPKTVGGHWKVPHDCRRDLRDLLCVG